MNKSDELEFTSVLIGMASMYNKDLTQAQISIWFDALSRFDFQNISQAFQRYITGDSSDFWPKPGAIIKIMEGSGADRGSRAWMQVDRAIRTIGPYQTVIFEDWAIHVTVEQMGGWIKMCKSESDEDHKFLGIRFEKQYLGVVSQQYNGHPKKLVGISEATNGPKNKEPPVMIGHEQNCIEVYKTGGAKRQETTRLSIDSFNDMINKNLALPGK